MKYYHAISNSYNVIYLFIYSYILICCLRLETEWDLDADIWEGCQPFITEHGCGHGQQSRILNCVARISRDIINSSYCTDNPMLLNISLVRECFAICSGKVLFTFNNKTQLYGWWCVKMILWEQVLISFN